MPVCRGGGLGRWNRNTRWGGGPRTGDTYPDPALTPGPTDRHWTTPSAAWGSSSTCRRRRRRRMPGCRRGRSTTSCSRTSWWTCTSRCAGRLPLPGPPPPASATRVSVPGAQGHVALTVPPAMSPHSRSSMSVRMTCPLDLRSGACSGSAWHVSSNTVSFGTKWEAREPCEFSTPEHLLCTCPGQG